MKNKKRIPFQLSLSRLKIRAYIAIKNTIIYFRNFFLSTWLLLLFIVLLFLCVINYEFLHKSDIYIEPMSNIVSIITSILTLLSIFIAFKTLQVSLRAPKLDIVFFNQHSQIMGTKNTPLPIGLNKHNEIDYQTCVPSDWSMKLVNIGNNVAKDIRVKFQIEDVMFDASLSDYGFDLYGFEYGCGVFNSFSYNLTSLLRQGESIDIPRIPFYASEFEHDLSKGNKLKMIITLYSGNNSMTTIKKTLSIEYSDSFDNSNKIETHNLKNCKDTFINWYCLNVEKIYDLSQTDLIDPYAIPIFTETTIAKNIFEHYKNVKVNKEFLFWGRIYYRSLGLTPTEIESILNNDMTVLNINKSTGAYNTLHF